MRTGASVDAGRRSRSRTVAGEFARVVRRVTTSRDPGFERYRGKPVEFQREVLGYEPIDPQVEILEALERGSKVAVPSGRAMGKSRIDGGSALYFMATRPNACVVLLAPTFKQIQTILWEEIRTLYRGARIPLGGDFAKLANTGGRLPNGSRVFGITGDKPEDLQGIRAAEMMVICDEASGIPDEAYTALEGNLAGGGRLLLTGNPTRPRGYFRDACRSERFAVVHMPSTRSPNVIAGKVLIPGIATAEWISERQREWGEDSPFYKIHVLGEFVEFEEGRLFSVAALDAAHERWKENRPPTAGRLVVGLDPAGESGEGDESVWAPRIGRRVLELRARRGLTADGHVVETLGVLREFAGARRTELPAVVVDRDGYVGARVYAALSAYAQQNPGSFQLVGIRGGERARRRPHDIHLVRDEMWLALVDALREGLELPEDLRLSADLGELRLEHHASGRAKVTHKDEIRRNLGRSPDRGDAVVLSVFEPPRVDVPAAGSTQTAPRLDPYAAEPAHTFDPYAALDASRGQR